MRRIPVLATYQPLDFNHLAEIQTELRYDDAACSLIRWLHLYHSHVRIEGTSLVISEEIPAEALRYFHQLYRFLTNIDPQLFLDVRGGWVMNNPSLLIHS